MRLYAEDVVAGFLPSTGLLSTFEIPGREPDGPDAGRAGVRVDTGVESGSVVSPHYDAMLAKVVAWAPTRAEAARRLAAALAGARLHGVTTNRDLLVRILRSEEFLAGGTDTAFLTRHDPAALGAPLLGRRGLAQHAVAAALCGAAARRAAAAVQPGVPSGWRNVRSAPRRVRFDAGPEVTYAYGRGGALTVTVDGDEVAVRVLACTPDAARRRGRRAAAPVRRGAGRGDGVRGLLVGSCALVETPRLPLPGSSVAAGSLLAPMPGSVLRVAVAAGDVVEAGEVLVVLEAMKMEHAVRAPAKGTVTALPVAVGAQVGAGDVLAVVEAAGD